MQPAAVGTDGVRHLDKHGEEHSTRAVVGNAVVGGHAGDGGVEALSQAGAPHDPQDLPSVMQPATVSAT